MITYKEFEVLKNFYEKNEKEPGKILKNVHHKIFKDVHEVESCICSLREKGYLKEDSLTEVAEFELSAHKVNNAIILAAGGSEISAKSVYSMPKGLFMKDGETLIERQIRQLKEVGIHDITVVIAYKQELYFFLQEKWNVKLEINPTLKSNNIASLYSAINDLGSTYICSCDNYFEKNPFSLYEYHSYHATVYRTETQNELLVRKNENDRLLGMYPSKEPGECLYGHAYIEQEFSDKLKRYLKTEINDFRISSLFWEEFVEKHLDDLDMYLHEYSDEMVFEFDEIQQIQNVEGLFLGSISEKINAIICNALSCKEEEITDIEILEKGLTNVLFTFIVKKEKYIFRYPGESSKFLVVRKNECRAQKIAADVHVDDTYVYIDEEGIKISKFRENCENLQGKYYQDVELMKRIAKQIRVFHDAGRNIPDWKEYEFEPIAASKRLFKEASKVKGNLLNVFAKEWQEIQELYKYTQKDGIAPTMCHNDINMDNVLLTDNSLDIIDWEYAGFNDPGYDFGRVIAGLDYAADEPKILDILEAYFGRPATEIEHVHFMAYTTFHNWHYLGWCLYKESINEYTREWMLFFYKQTKKLLAWCLPKYESIYGKLD